jgi:hypothetical protein
MGSGKGKSRRAQSTAQSKLAQITQTIVEEEQRQLATGELQEWHLPNGDLHRVGGPARIKKSSESILRKDGRKEWYRYGQRHRVDGPAVEHESGDREWWLDGKPHRVDGPAQEYADGGVVWWLDGKVVTEEKVNEANEARFSALAAQLQVDLPEKVKF